MSGICYLVGAAAIGKNLPAPEKGDLLIAADAGLASCRALGLEPDIVVGDFDSLGYVPEHPRVIRHPVIKDATDTELALNVGRERGYADFVLYGCIGGRLGHTLGNLQTMAGVSRSGQRILAVGEDNIAACITDGDINFTQDNTGFLSLFPMGGDARGVTLRGLKYELTDAVLPASGTLGVSNEFLGRLASVRVEHGTVLALWQQKSFSPHEFWNQQR